MTMKFLLTTSMTVLALAGCGSTARDVARFQGTAVEAFAVQIVAVDGTPVAGNGAPMEPGLRKVTVQMPAAAGFKVGDQRTIDLDVKACTKYWLVAQRDNRVGPQFDVRVDHEQRVHSCARRVG